MLASSLLAHRPPVMKPLIVLKTPKVTAPRVVPIVMRPLPGGLCYVRHTPAWILRGLNPDGPNGRASSAHLAGSAMTGQSAGFHYEEQAAPCDNGPEYHAELPGGSEVQHTAVCTMLELSH